jgi:hypothetical protein
LKLKQTDAIELAVKDEELEAELKNKRVVALKLQFRN